MSGQNEVNEAGRLLREKLNANILITRGKGGMTLFSGQTLEIPTYAKEVFDVTGAGDSVIATIALSLAAGSTLEEAAVLANHAAGIVVEKAGTYSVGIEELERELLRKNQFKNTYNNLYKSGFS